MTEQEQEKINITLQDVVLAVQVIDTCTKRGAIEGNEMATVGQLRDKLANFVNQNMPKQEEAENENQTES